VQKKSSISVFLPSLADCLIQVLNIHSLLRLYTCLMVQTPANAFFEVGWSCRCYLGRRLLASGLSTCRWVHRTVGIESPASSHPWVVCSICWQLPETITFIGTEEVLPSK
jgi:hypothetical protein